MQSNYLSPALRQLRDQQVRFTPRDKQIEQMDRAQSLLTEIDAEREYPYEYLCYRITGFRPSADGSSPEPIAGEVVQHDLRRFVEDLSDKMNLRVEDLPERVYTIEELAKQFNVSTKTISRWREQGLVSHRFIFDGRKRVGFTDAIVQRFVTDNKDRIERGERFSQLTDENRHEIVDRARRLAQRGDCPSEIARQIASQMGRSVETIRYTLKNHDERNPDRAVFPDRSQPLNEAMREAIYNRHRAGETIEGLARRYGRTKTSVYRILSEVRLQKIEQLPLDFVPNESFDDPAMEAEILADISLENPDAKKIRVPAGLPPYLASLYEVPLLSREQEYHLFRKMNFLKSRAAKLREELEGRPRAALMDKIESLYEDSVKVKNRIVQANLRLVVSIAKRHVTPSNDFFTLISDGNMSLIRAAEKFDFSRGNKFSTYASWAIMKNFARTIPEEYKRQDRFRTLQDEVFLAREDSRSDQYELESAQAMRREQVAKILSRLDDREKQIIISRFGLNHSDEPLTLKEVGAEMGVTKERVRQIEFRALNKLRAAVKDEKIDTPD